MAVDLPDDEDDPVALAEAKARAWQRQLLQRTAVCDGLEEQLQASEETRLRLADELAALKEEQLRAGGRFGGGNGSGAESLEKLRTVRSVLALDRASLKEMKREIGIFDMEVKSLFSGGFGPVAAVARAAAEHADALSAARSEADSAR